MDAEGRGAPASRTPAWVWAVAVLGAMAAGVLLAFGAWLALDQRRAVAPLAAPPALAGQPGSSTLPTRPATTTSSPPVPSSPSSPSSSVPAIGATPGADRLGPLGTLPLAAEVGQPTVGTCLTFVERNGAERMRSVDCAVEHPLEVVGVVDVSARFGSRPTDEEWRSLLTTACSDELRRYLGGVHDPYGIVQLRIAAPTDAEWGAGDHVGECLASTGTDQGALRTSTGSVRDLDQSPAPMVGTCHRLAAVEGRAIGCDEAHELEVIGTVDLTAQFEHHPAAADWERLQPQCLAMLRSQLDTGQLDTGQPGGVVAAAPLPIPLDSWLAGQRVMACAAAEIDQSTGQAIERVGSLRH